MGQSTLLSDELPVDNRCPFSSLAPGQVQCPFSAEETKGDHASNTRRDSENILLAEENKSVPAGNSDACSESVERVLQVSKLINFEKLVTCKVIDKNRFLTNTGTKERSATTPLLPLCSYKM